MPQFSETVGTVAQAILSQMVACPPVVKGVELVSSRFRWCGAGVEAVVVMVYGKHGATCWLARAVRTLMKRVEMLEARDTLKNVDCNIHVNTSVSRHRSDGNLETQYTSPKVLLPGQNPAADLEHGGAISADDNLLDMGISPMHGDGFKQVLSNGLSTMLH